MHKSNRYESPRQDNRNSVLPLNGPDPRPPQLSTPTWACQCDCVSGGRGGSDVDGGIEGLSGVSIVSELVLTSD